MLIFESVMNASVIWKLNLNVDEYRVGVGGLSFARQKPSNSINDHLIE